MRRGLLLLPLRCIFLGAIGISAPMLFAQLTHFEGIPSQALSCQVREFKLEAGATSAQTSFVFNHEKNAFLSMQFLTKDLSLVLTDPNGRKLPWDENSTEVDCYRNEGPHPEDDKLTIYAYHFVIPNPLDGEWKVDVTFNTPLQRKWFTPVNLLSSGGVGIVLEIPEPKALAGIPISAAFVVTDNGSLVENFTYTAIVHHLRIDGTGSDDTSMEFKKQVQPDNPTPNWVGTFIPATPGLYYLDVTVSGESGGRPFERNTGAMVEAFPVKARVGGFTSQVK